MFRLFGHLAGAPPRVERALGHGVLWALALGALALAAACAGDHTGLGKDDPSSSGSGVAGAGGSSGAGGSTSSSSGTGVSGGGGVIEPPGPTTLTVVNGVVDQPAVRVCFVPYPGGDAQPWPDPSGLGYGRGEVVEPLAQVVPPSGDAELVAIGGALSLTAGKSCVALQAGPPSGVVVSSLGVLPESALSEPKSLLVVVTGCLGGVGHTDEQLEALVCGPGYSEASGNASAVAGFMSRLTEPDKLAFQFVHASQALGQANLHLKPGVDAAVAQVVLSGWLLGAIAPFPPYTYLSATGFGDPALATLELYPQGSSSPASELSFSEVLAASALSAADLVDGRGMVLVAVGPMPTVAAGAWWNDFTFAAVAAAP